MPGDMPSLDAPQDHGTSPMRDADTRARARTREALDEQERMIAEAYRIPLHLLRPENTLANLAAAARRFDAAITKAFFADAREPGTDAGRDGKGESK